MNSERDSDYSYEREFSEKMRISTKPYNRYDDDFIYEEDF